MRPYYLFNRSNYWLVFWFFVFVFKIWDRVLKAECSIYANTNLNEQWTIALNPAIYLPVLFNVPYNQNDLLNIFRPYNNPNFSSNKPNHIILFMVVRVLHNGETWNTCHMSNGHLSPHFLFLFSCCCSKCYYSLSKIFTLNLVVLLDILNTMRLLLINYWHVKFQSQLEMVEH